MFDIQQDIPIDAQRLRDVEKLASTIAHIDKVRVKLYRRILLGHTSNLMVYKKNTLIGFMTHYRFKPDRVELVFMVHPKHRRKGLFTQLWALQQRKLSRETPALVATACPQHFEPSEACLKKLSARFERVEFFMERHGTQKETNHSMVQLQYRKAIANREDSELLAKLDIQCFHASYEEAVSKFYYNHTLPYRSAWMGFLGNQLVAKVHMRFDDHGVFIHEIGVDEAYRGKGFAYQAVQHTINYLIDEGHDYLFLDVDEDNSSAVAVYKKCGFSVKQAYNYYFLPSPNEPPGASCQTS